MINPAVLVIHLVSIIMTIIMILHVRSKYTAVGRKEILLFFYLYIVTTLVEFLTVSGIIPLSSNVFNYAVSVYTALAVTTFWCLFANGLVPFQFIEDGTPMSVWTLRISCLVVFLASLFVSVATVSNIAGFSSANPTALWILYLVFPPIMVILYAILQVMLVLRTLEDRWSIGDILFGVVFFLTSQALNFVASPSICEMAKHYMDGMFFGNIFSLLAVMMVYKFWDGITQEDLEFAVGGKSNAWEIKDPLLNDTAMSHLSRSDYVTRS